MDFEPGLRIGPYRILKPLGSGGMGAVYLAQDERLDRRVALKMLTGAAGDEAARQIRREARAIARLNHPNIAALYDVFEHDSRSFLVMEYVDGERLTEIARSQPVPIDRVIDIGLQLVDALAYAHTAGIIHRDVKPANVMLTRDGKVKVLDLGLARVSTPPDSSTISMSDAAGGQRAGTPAYMSPERLIGEPADAASDVYSTGVLLFELLTGTRPFMAPDAVSLAVSVATKPVPHASSRRADVPAMLDDVVVRAMAKEPAARYASAAELYDDLIHVRDARPAVRDSKSGGRGRRSGHHAPSRPLPRPPWRRRALIAGAVAVAVAAIALWFALHRPLVSLPANFAVASVVAAGTNDAELDELAALLGSALSRNLAGRPGITVVASASASANYRTAISLRRTVTGLSAEVALERDGSRQPVWRSQFEGDALGVVRFALDGMAAAIERGQSGRNLRIEDRSRLRQLPTWDAQALASFMRGAALLDTSDSVETDRQAVAAFSEAIQRDGQFAAAHAGLSQAQLGMFDRNRSDLSPRTIGRDAAAKAMAIDPDCDQAHLAASMASRALGQKEDAVNHARRAVALAPDGDDAHRVLGRALIEYGQPDEGFGALRTAIVLGPRHWINHWWYALQLLIGGKVRESIEPFQKVMDLRPDFQNSYVNLGVAYSELGDWEMAIGHAQRALAMKPGDAVPLNNLATAYYWTGRFPEALAAYQEAIRIDPASPRRHMNLGDTYERLGRKDDARKAYSEALTRADAILEKSNNPAMGAVAAKCVAKLGRFAEAERRALAAYSAADRDPAVVYKLAAVYALTGETDKALARLEEAVKLGHSLVIVRADWDLGSIANHPRFKALMSR